MDGKCLCLSHHPSDYPKSKEIDNPRWNDDDDEDDITGTPEYDYSQYCMEIDNEYIVWEGDSCRNTQ